MQFLRRHKILSAAMLVVLIVVAGLVIQFVATFLPVSLVISKETTYITEPLRSDGAPDYVAALNQQLSKGVTPENNAAVLFWKAAGPAPINKNCRTRYFQMLGIPPPPEIGDYYITSTEWTDRYRSRKGCPVGQCSTDDDDPFSGLFGAAYRPWSKQEFPEAAAWLAANEKPLALIIEGCKRPRRYDPLISVPSDDETLLGALSPDDLQCRDFARCLVLRAMLCVNRGNVDEAWNDLLACHRLARLVGQGPFPVDALTAQAVDCTANEGDVSLLQHAKLTTGQAAKMQQDLSALPPMPEMAEIVGQGERLTGLDLALWANRQATVDRGKAAANVGFPLPPGVDWNTVLRIINSWYDRLVTAARKVTRAERESAVAQILSDMKERVAATRGLEASAILAVGWRKAASERVGMSFVSLMLPVAAQAISMEDRATMQFDLTKLAFALAAYHAKHSRYPAKLATLVPKYVKEVPKDIFNNDADLHYSREGDGYLLYSVGDNGKDDGGKTRDDAKNGENWDDLAVRMSPPNPP
jgi:hypothetical protein